MARGKKKLKTQTKKQNLFNELSHSDPPPRARLGAGGCGQPGCGQRAAPKWFLESFFCFELVLLFIKWWTRERKGAGVGWGNWKGRNNRRGKN